MVLSSAQGAVEAYSGRLLHLLNTGRMFYWFLSSDLMNRSPGGEFSLPIKEKPLIDAVSRLGPLPAFLFSHPIFTGFFAIVMCPVFGAAFMVFQAAGYGSVEALELFEAARIGAIIALILAAIILIGIAVSAFKEPEETTVRLQFVFGGFLAIAMLVTLDRLFLDALRSFFAEAGPLV